MNNRSVDVIVSWPKSMDYPLWRDFILAHQQLFNKVIIVFTETHAGVDYSDFIMKSLPGVNFLFLHAEPVKNTEDWRDNAVNQALRHSDADWVWFTEQDLLILSPSFWPIISVGMASYDVIGYKEGSRFHPSNIFVARHMINKTRMDFGIVPNKADHFWKFYFDLKANGARIKNLKYKADQNTDTFYHMNGLSHNLSLIQRGEEPVYKVDEFKTYLAMTLHVEPLDDRYKSMLTDYFGVDLS